MEAQEYKTIFSVEDQHWWYVGMQKITVTLIAHLYPRRRDLRILDAGCGTGAVMRYLSPFGQVTGCDLSPLALSFCRRRELQLLNQASVMRLPIHNEQFDLVTSFDVLYHNNVADYHHALREFGRVLKPGGYILLRLPAYNWLRGHHDQIVHTARRFSAPELGQSLSDNGFLVEKLSYANTLLFPLALIKRLLETITPPGEGSDIHPNPAWQDSLFSRFLFAEARWLRGHSLPFGLTVIAIGKKL